MRGVDTEKAAYAAEAAAAEAAAAASAAGVHIKATPRKKKGASTTGDGEQGRERRPRSTSASAAVVAVPMPEQVQQQHEGGYATPIVGRHSVASVGGGGSGSGAGMRPPRSPLKQPKKACVPTLEDALDDVQVRFVLNLPEAELSSADRLFFQDIKVPASPPPGRGTNGGRMCPVEYFASAPFVDVDAFTSPFSYHRNDATLVPSNLSPNVWAQLYRIRPSRSIRSESALRNTRMTA